MRRESECQLLFAGASLTVRDLVHDALGVRGVAAGILADAGDLRPRLLDRSAGRRPGSPSAYRGGVQLDGAGGSYRVGDLEPAPTAFDRRNGATEDPIRTTSPNTR